MSCVVFEWETDVYTEMNIDFSPVLDALSAPFISGIAFARMIVVADNGDNLEVPENTRVGWFDAMYTNDTTTDKKKGIGGNIS